MDFSKPPTLEALGAEVAALPEGFSNIALPRSVLRDLLSRREPAAWPVEPNRSCFGFTLVECSTALPDDVLAIFFNRLPNGQPDLAGAVVVQR